MGGKKPRENEYIIRGMSSVPAQNLASPVTPGVAAVVVALLLSAVTATCGGGLFGKVYEYEEDVYLSLDGSADVIINASIPALVTLRGLDLPLDPATRIRLRSPRSRASVGSGAVRDVASCRCAFASRTSES
jgi:hypothetical protein